MAVLRDGTFDFKIGSEALSRGLRPSKRVPRNSRFLITCIGAVGVDKVLQVIDDLENDRIDTSAVITDGFPYPQIFIFTNTILICGETDIYECDPVTLALTHVIGPVASGEMWSAVDFFNFIYLTNNQVLILRNPTTETYALSTDYPIAKAACNFNGQLILGSPTEP